MESKILAGLKFDPGILIIGMLVLMLLMLIYIFQLHKDVYKRQIIHSLCVIFLKIRKI